LSARHALAEPAVRRLLAAGLMQYTARTMEIAVLGWLVTELTERPSAVALLGMFRSAPMFLLGLIAGTLVDRFSAKLTLRASQAALALSAAVVVALMAFDVVAVWHLYVALFVSGMGNSGDFSARRTLMSTLVPPRQLIAAVALDTTALTTGMLLGPLLAGWGIAQLGFAGAHAVVLGATLLAMILVSGVAQPAAAPRVAHSRFGAVRSLLRNRGIRAVFLITIVMNTFGFPFQFLLAVVARSVLGVGPIRYGLLSGAMGSAALITSLLLTWVPAHHATRVFAFGSALVLSSVVVLGLSQVYLLSLASMLAAGVGFAGFAAMQISIALRAAPPSLRGRAMGTVALGIGLQPLGVLAIGLIADAVGAPVALVVFGTLGGVLLAGVVLGMRLWRTYPVDGFDATLRRTAD
jgi:MFS family permease